jgi:hypothetical protein
MVLFFKIKMCFSTGQVKIDRLAKDWQQLFESL